MFEQLKALFAGRAQIQPPPASPARAVPTPSATQAIPKPSAQQIRDAGQKAHDEISSWVELWAENRKSEIPDKYRPLFSQYLAAFVQNDSATSDRHYTTLRKARTIEILASWGYPDPAA